VLAVESANDCLARARSLYRSGAFDQVLELLATALEQHPDHAGLWHFRGLAHHARGDFLEAIAALETLTTLAPLAAASQVALASSYLATGKGELARTIYRHLATFSEMPLHLLPQLAAGLDCLDELHLALTVRRAWASRDPGCAAAFFSAARSMARLKYPPESLLPFLWQAFQLAPDRILYRIDLAVAYHGCGNLAQARTLLQALPPAELAAISCPPRLHALVALFAAAGDSEREQACLARLLTLANRRRATEH
jgi:tetratricopeptide (TPR) repeat protein